MLHCCRYVLIVVLGIWGLSRPVGAAEIQLSVARRTPTPAFSYHHSPVIPEAVMQALLGRDRPSLVVPTIGIDAPLTIFPLDGVSWTINPWERAVGHLEGTGWFDRPGNIALGGHSQMPDGDPGVFAALDELHIGDLIILSDGPGEPRLYIVREIRTVRYDDLSVVYPTGYEQLTLITCDLPSRNPSTGHYDERLIVIAYPA